MVWNPSFKHCEVCNIHYNADECPSCNPKKYYHVEIGVPSGPDDFEFQSCECGQCSPHGFWDLKDAINHAKALVKFDGMVRVCDSYGVEVWEN